MAGDWLLIANVQNLIKMTWPFLLNGKDFEDKTQLARVWPNGLLAQTQDGVEASALFELRSIFWD
jgi:hypothetical protein